MKLYCCIASILIICVQRVCHGAVLGGVGIAGVVFATGAGMIFFHVAKVPMVELYIHHFPMCEFRFN